MYYFCHLPIHARILILLIFKVSKNYFELVNKSIAYEVVKLESEQDDFELFH